MYFYYQSLLRAMTQNFTLVPVIKKKKPKKCNKTLIKALSGLLECV